MAELQGLLVSLVPLIAAASASTTKHDNTFTIPGTHVELDSGADDLYGRTTMLACRLLFSVLKGKGTTSLTAVFRERLRERRRSASQTETNPTPVDDDGLGRTHVIMAVSASMYNAYDMLSDDVNEVDFGNTSIGSMASHDEGGTGRVAQEAAAQSGLHRYGARPRQEEEPRTPQP